MEQRTISVGQIAYVSVNERDIQELRVQWESPKGWRDIFEHLFPGSNAVGDFWRKSGVAREELDTFFVFMDDFRGWQTFIFLLYFHQ